VLHNVIDPSVIHPFIYKIIDRGYVVCRLPSLIFKGNFHEISFFCLISFMFGLLSLFSLDDRALMACAALIFVMILKTEKVSYFAFSLMSFIYLLRWV
jgi:hypothetical protein